MFRRLSDAYDRLISALNNFADSLEQHTADLQHGRLVLPPAGETTLGEALDASKPNGRPHSKPRARVGK